MNALKTAPPALIPFGVDTESLPKEATSLEPAPGWHWAVQPRELSPQELKCNIRLLFKNAPPAWRIEGGELQISLPKEPGCSFRLLLGYGDGRRMVRSPAAQGEDFRFYFLPADFQPEWLEALNEAELAFIRKTAFQEVQRLKLTVLSPVRLEEAVFFELKTVDGKLIGSKEFQGKAVVIFEWATWCNSCHRQIEALAKLAALHKGQIVFIGICHDEEKSHPRAEAQMAEISQKLAPSVFHVALLKLSSFSDGVPLSRTQELWQLVRDGTGQAYGIPRALVLDKNSKALLDTTGFQEQALTEAINQALKPDPAEAAS